MPKKIFMMLLVATAVLTGLGCKTQTIPIENLKNNITRPMQLTSPSFKNNEHLPITYTCDGKGVNPTLQISDVPEGTLSLALIMGDPDAPSGDFVHWVLWNIDPRRGSISENTEPEEAAAGITSANSTRYVPPCPPSGIHHYIFTLYALDIKLNLPSTTSKTQLVQAMEGHVITQAELMSLYGR